MSSPAVQARPALTHDDLEHHERHLNARNTLVTLLSHGVVPIINENDAVSFTEIKVGDNDTLSALVASLLPADLLVILTTVGGWGVVTSDQLALCDELRLLELPADLQAAIDAKLPPRWSRNNPVDCAGGETRDTIPEVLELIAAHPEVHSVIYLGLGIQSNQARLMREGRGRSSRSAARSK